MMSINRRSPGRLACAVAAASLFAVLPLAPVEAQSAEVRQITSSCYSPCVVTAKANETVEVILPDATSVVLAPGSQARISRAADSSVIVEVQRGRARVAGGARNASLPIQVTTPHAILSVMDAAVFVSVEGDRTRTHLLNGDAVLVTVGGTTRRIYRPGYQSIATASRVSTPRRMDVEDVVADLLSIAPGLTTGQRPRVTSAAAGTGGAPVSGTVSSGDAGETDVASLGEDDGFGDDERIANEEDPGGSSEDSFDVGGIDDGLLLADATGSSVGDPLDVSAETSSTAVFTITYTGTQDTRVLGTIEDEDLGPLYDTEPKSAGPSSNRIVFTENNDSMWNVTDPSSTTFVSLGSTVNELGEPSNQLVWFDSSEGIFGYLDKGSAVYNANQIRGTFFFGVDTVVGETDADLFRIHPQVFTANSFDAYDGGSNRQPSAFYTNPADVVLETGDILSEGYGAFSTGIVSGAGFAEFEQDNFFLSEIEAADAIEIGPSDREYLIPFCGVADFCAAYYSLPLSEQRALREADFQARVARLEDFLGQESLATDEDTLLFRNPNPSFRVVLATGDLDALVDHREADDGFFNLAPGEIDRFHLAGSMQGELAAEGIGTMGDPGVTTGMDPTTGRAFLNRETWTDLASAVGLSELTDTGVILRYPDAAVEVDAEGDGDGAGGTPAVVLHADIGIAGAGASQVSSMSVTVGKVSYRLKDFEMDGLIEATTVGASQDAGESTLVFHSDLHSSAAGGGNQRLTEAPGRLGFFVLENAGTLYDDLADSAKSLDGGIGFSLDDSSSDDSGDSSAFALLRIGVGTESSDAPTTRGFELDGAETVGYAAGFLETLRDGTVSLARFQAAHNGTSLDAPRANLSFSDLDAEAHTFEAQLTLGGEPITFGGDDPSAFINDREFGALSLGGKPHGEVYDHEDFAMAMVSGETGTGDNSISRALTSDGIRRNDHVKWGFFLGDALISDSRTHVHMATFAAGDRVELTSTTQPSGTSLFRGHAVGTVVQDGNSRVVVGGFEDRFNFDTRRGNFDLNFDGVVHSGQTRLSGTGTHGGRSTGPMLYSGGGITDGLVATVAGEFVSNGGMLKPTLGGGMAPGGLVGSFDIGVDVNGSRAGSAYSATGTFGADNLSLDE